MALRRQTVEKSVQKTFFLIAMASITTLFLIMVFLFREGLPIFKTVSVKEFVFGHYWYPTSEPPDFGIFPLYTCEFPLVALSKCKKPRPKRTGLSIIFWL